MPSQDPYRYPAKSPTVDTLAMYGKFLNPYLTLPVNFQLFQKINAQLLKKDGRRSQHVKDCHFAIDLFDKVFHDLNDMDSVATFKKLTVDSIKILTNKMLSLVEEETSLDVTNLCYKMSGAITSFLDYFLNLSYSTPRPGKLNKPIPFFTDEIKDLVFYYLKYAAEKKYSWLFSLIGAGPMETILSALENLDDSSKFCEEIKGFVYDIAESVIYCGDYSCQASLLLIVVVWLSKVSEKEQMRFKRKTFVRLDDRVKDALTTPERDSDWKIHWFLMFINETSAKFKRPLVFTINCLYGFVGNEKLNPGIHEHIQDFYISFSQRSFRTSFVVSFQPAGPDWHAINIEKEMIDSVCVFWSRNTRVDDSPNFTLCLSQQCLPSTQKQGTTSSYICFLHIKLKKSFHDTFDLPEDFAKIYKSHSIIFAFDDPKKLEQTIQAMRYERHIYNSTSCVLPPRLTKSLEEDKNISYSQFYNSSCLPLESQIIPESPEVVELESVDAYILAAPFTPAASNPLAKSAKLSPIRPPFSGSVRISPTVSPVGSVSSNSFGESPTASPTRLFSKPGAKPPSSSKLQPFSGRPLETEVRPKSPEDVETVRKHIIAAPFTPAVSNSVGRSGTISPIRPPLSGSVGNTQIVSPVGSLSSNSLGEYPAASPTLQFSRKPDPRPLAASTPFPYLPLEIQSIAESPEDVEMETVERQSVGKSPLTSPVGSLASDSFEGSPAASLTQPFSYKPDAKPLAVSTRLPIVSKPVGTPLASSKRRPVCSKPVGHPMAASSTRLFFSKPSKPKVSSPKPKPTKKLPEPLETKQPKSRRSKSKMITHKLPMVRKVIVPKVLGKVPIYIRNKFPEEVLSPNADPYNYNKYGDMYEKTGYDKGRKKAVPKQSVYAPPKAKRTRSRSASSGPPARTPSRSPRVAPKTSSKSPRATPKRSLKSPGATPKRSSKSPGATPKQFSKSTKVSTPARSRKRILFPDVEEDDDSSQYSVQFSMSPPLLETPKVSRVAFEVPKTPFNNPLQLPLPRTSPSVSESLVRSPAVSLTICSTSPDSSPGSTRSVYFHEPQPLAAATEPSISKPTPLESPVGSSSSVVSATSSSLASPTSTIRSPEYASAFSESVVKLPGASPSSSIFSFKYNKTQKTFLPTPGCPLLSPSSSVFASTKFPGSPESSNGSDDNETTVSNWREKLASLVAKEKDIVNENDDSDSDSDLWK